jgi:hypothetical protein
MVPRREYAIEAFGKTGELGHGLAGRRPCTAKTGLPLGYPF